LKKPIATYKDVGLFNTKRRPKVQIFSPKKDYGKSYISDKLRAKPITL
tara:strand:+ start:301 stop:444 length:144 start_codon:yes stop_codon:yes gene_type:complete